MKSIIACVALANLLVGALCEPSVLITAELFGKPIKSEIISFDNSRKHENSHSSHNQLTPTSKSNKRLKSNFCVEIKVFGKHKVQCFNSSEIPNALNPNNGLQNTHNVTILDYNDNQTTSDYENGEFFPNVLTPIETIFLRKSIKKGYFSSPTMEHKCDGIMSNGKFKLICYHFGEIPSTRNTNNQTDTHIVRILDLSHKNNRLTTLRKNELFHAGYYQSHLMYLWLKNNQISSIEIGALRNMDALTEIDLSFNKIRTLDMQVFDDSVNLKILKLNNNPIHTLQGNQGLKTHKLEKLYLNNCQLNEIPQNAFTELKNLRELYLSSNHLHRLSWKNFNNKPILSTLTLANNDWVCDCHLHFLLQKLEQYKQLSLRKTLNCKHPQYNNSKFWEKLSREQLFCPPKIINLFEPVVNVQSNQTKVQYIECKVEAFPKPFDFKWLKNGEEEVNAFPCNNNPTPPYDQNFNFEYCLVLPIYSISTHTTFDCIAENEAGKANVSVFFHVTDSVSSREELFGIESFEGKNVTDRNVWLWIYLLGIAVVALCVTLLITLFCFWKRNWKNRGQKKVCKIASFEKENLSNSSTENNENQSTGDVMQGLIIYGSNEALV